MTLKNNPNERLAVLLSAFIVLSDDKTNSKLILSNLKKYIKTEDLKNIKRAKKLIDSTFKEVEKWQQTQ